MNKMIYCQVCHDLKTLRKQHTRCVCGKATGKMLDNNLAEVNEYAIPVGINTKTFQFALDSRPETGLGVPFTAFIMAKENARISIKNTK